MSTSTRKLADSLRDAFVAALGQAGWQALTDRQRLLVEECTLDAAELQLAALAAASDPAATAALAREKSHVTAQLASIAAAQSARATAALWDAAASSLIRAAALLAA